MNIRLLNDEDIMILQGLVSRFKTSRKNPIIDEATLAKLERYQASTGVYIAKTPVGGIDAMNTGGADPIPGTATCVIYHITFVGTDSTPYVTEIDGLTKTVYNLSTSAISADTWIPVYKTNGGHWVAGSVGGGGVSGYKDVIFRLSAALSQSSSTGTATIHWQFGIGTTSPNTGVGAITVNNLPKSSGDYVFYGDSGDYGIGIWDNGNEYQIIMMECP